MPKLRGRRNKWVFITFIWVYKKTLNEVKQKNLEYKKRKTQNKTFNEWSENKEKEA